MLRAPGIVMVLTVLTACGSVKSPADVLFRYEFDDGLVDDEGQLTVADASGNDRPGVVESENDGDQLLEVVAGEDGQALQFPPRCAEEDPSLCPRAILRASASNDENPGTADFAIGVDLLVAPEEAGVDQNVMQKGNFDDAAQWKIQVSGEDRGQCVFRIPGQDDALVLESEASVADGAWHTVRCLRQGTELSIDVDGARSSTSIPADVNFSNPRPLLMGGRDTGAENDQLHGTVDNATFELL
jgi:Concanavalin A-like lectin/glucanases superfamily